MHIRLIAAETLPAISGAAIYNRTIAEALLALGHTVDLTTDAAAMPHSVTLVDGSALLSLPVEDLQEAVALVHHPLALETIPPDAALLRQETELFARVRRIVTTSEQTAERL